MSADETPGTVEAVEAAARALYAEARAEIEGQPFDPGPTGPAPTWEEAHPSTREHYRSQVRPHVAAAAPVIADAVRAGLAADIGEDGMVKHLPMGVTKDGRGPTEPDEPHHRVCWCGEPKCCWTVALAAERDAVRAEVTAAVEALADEWERLADGNEAARGRKTKVAGYYRRHAALLRAALAAAGGSDASDADGPSPDAIARLVAASPNITPVLVARLQHVIRQIEGALQDERLGEPAQAWLRTMLRACYQEDWDEGVVGEFLRGERDSTIEGGSDALDRVRAEALREFAHSLVNEPQFGTMDRYTIRLIARQASECADRLAAADTGRGETT